ncbi:MAG: HAD family hydrolase [Bacillota bacterium]
MKAALFDVGDTLVHKWVHKRDRFCWLCEQAGLEVPADPVVRLQATQAVDRFFQARQTHPLQFTEPWWVEHNAIGLAALGLPADAASALYRRGKELPGEDYIDPEVVPLLRHLRERGYKIGFVSNWDGSLAERTARWGLTPYVDFIGDSAVFGSPKPDPAFFHHVLEQLGVDAADAFHVGDSWGADVVGALAAGVTAVLFDPVGCEDRPADHVVRDLGEIYALLDRLESR